MSRDPFYRKIVERLRDNIDPYVFQDCAVDLIKQDIPSIVLIGRGYDFGMDGAIADGKGEPFPLICTTNKSVITNLSKSLQSYLEKGGSRRKAVVATSQHLTPTMRKNLEEKAREYGFILIQIYDRDAIANLLYRNPRWCKELLNLSGNPSALSTIPKSIRPFSVNAIVGRESSLKWLRETTGDRLVYGQPGSGKTFLFQHYVKESGSLFVVSDDINKIAEGIREQDPKILIVDDANSQQSLLAELRHFREETGADFSILASCWPGEKAVVAKALYLPSNSIMELDLLSRDAIVEVIKEAGIAHPPELIRELVDQAGGRPGLAVTLSRLCVLGEVETVVYGDALGRWIRNLFQSEPKAFDVLACFAVGGDRGMKMKDVANALEMAETEVKTILTSLGSGGVIWDVGNTHLSVWPEPLRYFIVKEVFFCGAQSLSEETFMTLMSRAPIFHEAVDTVIGAKERGGYVPSDMLLELVEKASSASTWNNYARLGRGETEKTLHRHPELIGEIAWPALYNKPESALLLLLQKAVGDNRALHSTPEHPLRLIDDWVKSSYPGSGEAYRRRKALLDALEKWFSSDGDINVGFQALVWVLSPKYESNRSDPGSGNVRTLTFGVVSLSDLKAIAKLWPRALELFRRNVGNPIWKNVLEVIKLWAYPESGSIQKLPMQIFSFMQNIAGNMVHDVLGISKSHQGVRRCLKQIVLDREFNIEVSGDQEFETLFPISETNDWKQEREVHHRAAVVLAKKWISKKPEIIIRRISELEMEADLVDIRHPRYSWNVCAYIAKNVTPVLLWAKEAVNNQLAPDLVEIFLRYAASSKEKGWEKLATRCIKNNSLKAVGITVVLTAPLVSTGFLEKVIRDIEGHEMTIETLALRGEVPVRRLVKLLRHNDSKISIAAAVGEWFADPEGSVRKSLKADWRVAALNIDENHHGLEEILGSDAELAYTWLKNRILKSGEGYYDFTISIRRAIDVMSAKQRRKIISCLKDNYFCRRLVAYIIGNDMELCREFLENETMRHLHMEVLRGKPGGSWILKALIAMDNGYSPQDMVEASIGFSQTWTGKESDIWADWISSFDRLRSHEDELIRQVGEIGERKASEFYNRALSREKNQSVHGYR